MSSIDPPDSGSVLRPLKALSFLFRDPVTLPMEPRPAAPNYRGFHLNDWDLCIGCGTCHRICDNGAIRMIHLPDLPADPIKGVKPRRPAIDYGRCCWCALCVDICPTGSLSLSREYVHVSRDIDSYFILPDRDGMHGLKFPKGWAKNDDSDLLDLDRQAMPQKDAAERGGGFGEIVVGFDAAAAHIEASRCVQCGMCHDACPAHMHAPEYIRAIWEGDIDKAVAEIYRTNPFPHVCGRVCTHRCEAACSIGRRGEPVAIRWLKRHAMDNVDPRRVREIAAAGRAPTPSGRRVAVIGSGPAGLTAAFDLARQGHAVTVFEAKPRPGGMMRYGIPAYRLPADKLDADIGVIESVGVEIRCDQPLGSAVQIDDLRRDFDAVLIATGLGQGRSTRVPGAEHPDVRSAIELLELIGRGESFPVPPRVVVIGGGNVAFDIARSLARLQRMNNGSVDVTLTVLEARDRMLADETEVLEAEEEGIARHNGRGPKQVIVEDGKLVALETVACLSTCDADGRFHPTYDKSDVMTHPADLVVEAIGQRAATGYLGEALVEALEWQRGRLVIDETGRTSEPWLWAAGDMVEGPDVIHAVAAGHRAAAGIHQALAAVAVEGEGR